MKGSEIPGKSLHIPIFSGSRTSEIEEILFSGANGTYTSLDRSPGQQHPTVSQLLSGYLKTRPRKHFPVA